MTLFVNYTKGINCLVLGKTFVIQLLLTQFERSNLLRSPKLKTEILPHIFRARVNNNDSLLDHFVQFNADCLLSKFWLLVCSLFFLCSGRWYPPFYSATLLFSLAADRRHVMNSSWISRHFSHFHDLFSLIRNDVVFLPLSSS